MGLTLIRLKVPLHGVTSHCLNQKLQEFIKLDKDIRFLSFSHRRLHTDFFNLGPCIANVDSFKKLIQNRDITQFVMYLSHATIEINLNGNTYFVQRNKLKPFKIEICLLEDLRMLHKIYVT